MDGRREAVLCFHVSHECKKKKFFSSDDFKMALAFCCVVNLPRFVELEIAPIVSFAVLLMKTGNTDCF